MRPASGFFTRQPLDPILFTIIGDLFHAFMGERRLLPPQFQQQAAADCPRAVSDYIAGMTDHYAIKEHRRLFAIEEE